MDTIREVAGIPSQMNSVINTKQRSFGYGTDSPVGPGKRKRLNTLAICLNIFLPWLVFSAIFSLMCLSVHYTRPKAVRAAVAFGFALSLGSFILAYRSKYRDFDMQWYSFSGLALFIAVLLGWIFGSLNYSHNMMPYYDMENLNEYYNLNPAEKKGKEVMDAGKVWFADDVEIDFKKAIGFKNDHMYCVAPITFGDHQLPSYDFWAIGVDCCNGASGDFQCGEYENVHARAGLRLMDDKERPLFRLAVEMAESASNIKAQHPLFFYWVQDPIAEIHTYRDEGFMYCMLGMGCHFIFNTFWVCLSTYGFSRLGPWAQYGFYPGLTW